jgi:hypothetical protein
MNNIHISRSSQHLLEECDMELESSQGDYNFGLDLTPIEGQSREI